MPIYYFRHIDVLNNRDGILNEFPRYRGGSTIRVLRATSTDRATVLSLNAASPWMPWWIDASETWAQRVVENSYTSAAQSEMITLSERRLLVDLIELFRANCTKSGTIGEALNRTMEELYRRFLPDLPRINLKSLRFHSCRHLLASALERFPRPLTGALRAWAQIDGMSIFPMIAVGISEHGIATRIRFHPTSMEFEEVPLFREQFAAKSKGKRFELSKLYDMLRSGRLIPSSRLLMLGEVALDASGASVRHFGNTYGRILIAEKVLGVHRRNGIQCCPDNYDSWNYGFVRLDTAENSDMYPIHLLDIAALPVGIEGFVKSLVERSLLSATPIIMPFKGDLLATLSD